MNRRTFNRTLASSAGAIAARRSFSAEPSSPLELYYDTPAEKWLGALPLGNGRIGAMVFGGVPVERIVLNEDTLYAEEPGSRDLPLDITRDFDQVTAMIRSGQYLEADRYVTKHWLGRCWPCYQPLANLLLHLDHAPAFTSYRRDLDLRSAVSRVRYTSGGVDFEREFFLSAPDDVLVIRLRAGRPGALRFRLDFESAHPTARLRPSGVAEIVIRGQVPGIALRRTLDWVEQKGDAWKYPEIWNADGSRKPFAKQVLYGSEVDGRGTFFEVRVRALGDPRLVRSSGNGLEVTGGSEVVLLAAVASSFDGVDKSPSRAGIAPESRTRPRIESAAHRNFDELHNRHVADYRRFFDRVSLDLAPSGAAAALPTDQRARRFSEGGDPAMAALYFQFGRYLIISGSRPGTQPLNLQGIWNVDVIPPWASAYTTNINLEMNYWAANTANLADCEEPLFRLLQEMTRTGAAVARNMYHRPGWVMHHNTTLWRDAQPVDSEAYFSFWPMAGGWLCRHLWDHYLFSGDREFLRKTAYPIMKGAAEFYSAWLVDDGSGHLVTPVSTSPENMFYYTGEDGQQKMAGVAMGGTLDMAIIRELFGNVINASGLLGEDPQLRKTLEDQLGKLLPYHVGSRGQLLEYYKEFKEVPPRHNTSPFYPLYPGTQITLRGTPELASAERKLLEERTRNNGHWPSAWHACCWSRLGEAARAYSSIEALIARSTHPNLFNGRGEVFQIDGNLGGTAAIAEMLLQSHAGEIHLLPALPAQWSSGSVTGLRARGGFEIEMSWANSRLVSCKLYSQSAGEHKVRLPAGQSIAGASANPDGSFTLRFAAKGTRTLRLA